MKFNVDLRDIFDEFNLLQSQQKEMTKQVLDDVTGEVMRNWKKAAASKLKSSRTEYLNSIIWLKDTPSANIIALVGKLPNMIESGAQPFDMKEGFMRSTKIKQKKGGGWYLTIPFRWNTPGSIGENGANVMSQEVYKLARGLKSRKSAPGGSKPGQMLSSGSLPPSAQKLGSRKAVSNAITGQHFPSYQHKSPLAAGIQRNEKTYEKATQSTYNSFRRVSDKSDANSWIHTGIEAGNFAEQAFAATDFNTLVNNSIDSYLSNL